MLLFNIPRFIITNDYYFIFVITAQILLVNVKGVHITTLK